MAGPKAAWAGVVRWVGPVHGEAQRLTLYWGRVLTDGIGANQPGPQDHRMGRHAAAAVKKSPGVGYSAARGYAPASITAP